MLQQPQVARAAFFPFRRSLVEPEQLCAPATSLVCQFWSSKPRAGGRRGKRRERRDVHFEKDVFIFLVRLGLHLR